MDIALTRRQKRFIDATATEVLYGGAAGGGKSYGQCIDAFLFAIQHNGSKQLILRKTFAELEISIIRTMLSVYPTDICRYNASSHTFRFTNGSIIDCGYIGTDNDVTRYQSAEYDVIRFDELTHFSEYQYTYMLSRVRGANNFPKQVKSSTNPGSIGHQWVKARFVDCLVPDIEKKIDSTTRVFIPAKVTDNRFLMDSDPTYLDRLQALLGDRDLDDDVLVDLCQLARLAHHSLGVGCDDLCADGSVDDLGDLADHADKILALTRDQRGVGGNAADDAKVVCAADLLYVCGINKKLHLV
jgi:hypothetical protein